MIVYFPNGKKKSPRHTMYVCPGADKQLVKGEIPAEWKNTDGSPKSFTVEFINGAAAVADHLGRYMIQAGLARKTQLIQPGDA